jgi:hypothetical protein
VKLTLRERVASSIAALTIVAGLSGCGGSAELTCDEPRRYQQSTLHTGVTSPEDLDNLDTLRAMPLPKANPSPERPKGSPCLDLPPRVGPSK